MNKFSCRVVVIAGGALSTVGFVASAFCDSIDCVILTAGAVIGKSALNLHV